MKNISNSSDTFGSYIRRLRIKNDIGQRELAKKIGVAPSYLNDMEKGFVATFEGEGFKLDEKHYWYLEDYKVIEVEYNQQLYEGKISKLREKTQGQLVIKEYPTASAHSGHFKSLMNEFYCPISF